MIPILLLFWLRKVPESPRFLQSRGRTAEARKALAWALEVPVEKLGALPEVHSIKSASYSLIFSKYLKSLIIITVGSFCFILGASVIQSWGQSILGSGYKFTPGMVGALFMVVSLGDLLGRLASAWLADRIGRRWTMFSFGLIGALGLVLAASSVMLGQGVEGDVGNAGWIFFAGILIAMTFGDGAFGILNAFGAEQFPNEARPYRLGLGYGLGATAKIFGPMLLGSLFGKHVTLDSIPSAFGLFAALLVLGGHRLSVRQGNQGQVARYHLAVRLRPSGATPCRGPEPNTIKHQKDGSQHEHDPTTSPGKSGFSGLSPNGAHGSTRRSTRRRSRPAPSPCGGSVARGSGSRPRAAPTSPPTCGSATASAARRPRKWRRSTRCAI